MKVHISGKQGNERVNVKHDPVTNILTIEVTAKSEQVVIDLMREVFPLEIARASVEVCDVKNDAGRLYKDVRRYSMYCDDSDKLDSFFEATVKLYSKSAEQNLN